MSDTGRTSNVVGRIFMGIILFSTLYSHVVFADDDRKIILLSEAQRSAVLLEMRNMLENSQKILSAVIVDDMESVAKAAHASGMKMARNTPIELKKLLPQGFKSLGHLTHRGFEKIANEAEAFGDTKLILSLLSETQKSCIACHRAYQFKINLRP